MNGSQEPRRINSGIGYKNDMLKDNFNAKYLTLCKVGIWKVLEERYPNYNLITVLKYPDRRNAGRKGYWAYCSRVAQSIMVGKAGQEAGQAEWLEQEQLVTVHVPAHEA